MPVDDVLPSSIDSGALLSSSAIDLLTAESDGATYKSVETVYATSVVTVYYTEPTIRAPEVPSTGMYIRSNVPALMSFNLILVL